MRRGIDRWQEAAEDFCARKAQPVLRFRRDEMDALHSCFHRARDRSDVSHRLRLPARTTISRSINLQQTPEAVFAVLADVRRMAEWNRNTEKVEMLPPVGGKEATKQSFKGGMVMIIITAESTPPHHLVRTLGDTNTRSSVPGPTRFRRLTRARRSC